ncbi:hypothetical protein [Halarchaeum nitratireducens]|uniref:Uncharacterized protein n=1 Tax=Halarchaeum nitratireducens TaxID=489913 RepID=A0A830GEA0_9EURY|nr:hypothetical protein [Halarchaeum nitratireducens]GGN24917.1 hypothetical protein GCM10009021_28470 [Halarchaeum nitratireducens]
MSVEESARTMFARHKLGGDGEGIRWLKDNNYIAINWDDSPSTDETTYGDDGRSRGYQEVRRMRNVRDENRPVIIGAYYGNKIDEFRDRMVIGRIDPETNIHIIHYHQGETPSVYESEKAAREAGVPDVHEDEFPDKLEDEWVYKALPLVGCGAYGEPKEVSLTDYPLLSAVRPRHHSFCDWHVAEAHLKAFDAGHRSFRNINNSIDDLSDPLAPSQLEVICNEYLRLSDNHGSYTQLLPVGRTLRDVDIVGTSGGQKIFAQVTKATDSDLKSKAKKLATYKKPNVQTVLFGPENAYNDDEMPEGVDEYRSVRSVVDEVDAHSPELLDAMYELPEPMS